jgi:hypothetical protein
MQKTERTEIHKALATLMNWSSAVQAINNNSVSPAPTTQVNEFFDNISLKGSKCFYEEKHHGVAWKSRRWKQQSDSC